MLSSLQNGSDQHWVVVRICLSGASIVLLIVYGFTAAAEISHCSLNAQFSRGALFCILVLAALLAAAFNCWRPFRRRSLFVAVSVVCLGLSFLSCALVYKHPLSLWFVYRMVHIGNGVTPFVPAVLLSAALVWYACV